MLSKKLLQIYFILSYYGELTSATEANISSKGIMTRNIVDIARFTDSSAPGKTFSVYVDNTMTRLFVKTTVYRANPVVIVTKPSGIPGPRPNLNGTASTGAVTATIEANITAADCGIWKLTKLDSTTWNVKVQGESPLDFTYQFLQGSMIQTPIQGDPVQGETYKTVIRVPENATIQKVDMVLLFVTEKSSPANMMFPVDKGRGEYEVSSLKMLDKEFMIGIQGKDNSGNFFRRITVIKPIALILSVPSYTGVQLHENTKFNVAFSVINKLSKDQDIDVRIQDTEGFAEAPTIFSSTLKPGENFTGKFVITGGVAGVTTTVTITAKPYLGRGQISHGPIEVRHFTVERYYTTTYSPALSSTYKVTSTTAADVTSIDLTTSSSVPSMSLSASRKDPPASSQVSTARTTSKTIVAPMKDKSGTNDKGYFFAIISAIVFKNDMNARKSVAGSQITLSENIQFAWP